MSIFLLIVGEGKAELTLMQDCEKPSIFSRIIKDLQRTESYMYYLMENGMKEGIQKRV